MSVLSVPYVDIVAPLLPGLLGSLFVVGAAWLSLDVLQRRSERGRLSVLVLFGLLLLLARVQADAVSASAIGLAVLAHGVALYGLARYDWPAVSPGDRVLPFWAGAVVIALAFACKCVALDTWPRILNSYSAWTGLDALHALEGHWPEGLLQGKEYDLMNGGHSPLMLPLMWCTMQIFGGNVFAVRMAEVIASTILLTFLWLWLRQVVRGGWGLLALAIFSISPWHLAQSRAGTFFSSSVALALMMLWVATRISYTNAGIGWWLTFGFGAGLIGYAYAPIKVLYAFFMVVVAVNAWLGLRRGAEGWWRGPLVAVTTFVLLLVVQLWNPERFGQMFRSEFGTLATDTSIWKKTAHDEITAARQPLNVIAENFFRNVREWLHLAYTEPGILVWFAPALSLGALIALVSLVRGTEWVTPAYYLTGLLPPLIIFPLMRRGLIVWPLVYVIGVVFARELARGASAILAAPAWRMACHAVVLIALAAASVHGFHLFATTNSIVRTGTYFGGDHLWRMVRAAAPLLPTHHIYFVNIDQQLMPIVEIEMFERGRAVGRRAAWQYLRVDAEDAELGALHEGEPLAFFHLVENEDMNDAILEKVEALLPGGKFTRYLDDDGSEVLLYSTYVFDPPSE